MKIQIVSESSRETDLVKEKETETVVKLQRYPKSRNFIILGCHRSGTTLLRLIMDSHTQIRCYEEQYAYRLYTTRLGSLRDILGSMRGISFDRLSADEEYTFIEGFKMPSWTELFVEYEELAKSYQGEPILFMLRDVRGAVASMNKLRDGGFLKGAVVRSLSHWERDNDRKILRSLMPELEEIRKQPHSLFGQGALYWKYKTQIYFDLLDKGYPILPVNYRKLVSAPIKEIKRICKFLDVDWQPQLMSHHDVDHSEVGKSGMTVGKTDATRPIDKESVGQWQKLLSKEEINAIVQVAGELNHKIMNLY